MFLFGLVPMIDGFVWFDVNKSTDLNTSDWQLVRDVSMYAAAAEGVLGLFGFLSRNDAGGFMYSMGWLGRFAGWAQEGYMVWQLM